ncbi:CBS domain-containing protein [Methylobacterium durans]|uniref:CBS domain-containing protein n=1 Tax=Methylobacterium durans TaxID=2202825 RepID=UPI002AFE150E|nr:CBS domain-containing protein [Methylobacterium durans]MEA1832456.1 CBS domain-containing protein [Methylobacterium durans]
MRVSEVMSRDVEFIGPDASARDAAILMGELDVGALPVGSAAEIEGVLTDRDLLYRVVAAGLDPNETRVGAVLSRPVVACSETDTVRAVMDMMAAHNVRRMPVRDAGGAVTGWITLADLSRTLLLGSDALQTSLKAMTEEA